MNEQQFVESLSKSLARPDKKAALIELSGMVLSLMRRIDRLEARPEVKYVGVWRDGEDYAPGMLTTLNGSLWHANRATTSRPGADNSWSLSVKSGTFTR